MYRIRWEIDMPADSPEQAARKALETMRRPDTTATVFCVTDPEGRVHKVDLGEAEPDVPTVLLEALRHAETRLNEIPHHYDDTNFRQIRDAIRLGEQHTGEP